MLQKLFFIFVRRLGIPIFFFCILIFGSLNSLLKFDNFLTALPHSSNPQSNPQSNNCQSSLEPLFASHSFSANKQVPTNDEVKKLTFIDFRQPFFPQENAPQTDSNYGLIGDLQFEQSSNESIIIREQIEHRIRAKSLTDQWNFFISPFISFIYRQILAIESSSSLFGEKINLRFLSHPTAISLYKKLIEIIQYELGGTKDSEDEYAFANLENILFNDPSVPEDLGEMNEVYLYHNFITSNRVWNLSPSKTKKFFNFDLNRLRYLSLVAQAMMILLDPDFAQAMESNSSLQNIVTEVIGISPSALSKTIEISLFEGIHEPNLRFLVNLFHKYLPENDFSSPDIIKEIEFVQKQNSLINYWQYFFHRNNWPASPSNFSNMYTYVSDQTVGFNTDEGDQNQKTEYSALPNSNFYWHPIFPSTNWQNVYLINPENKIIWKQKASAKQTDTDFYLPNLETEKGYFWEFQPNYLEEINRFKNQIQAKYLASLLVPDSTNSNWKIASFLDNTPQDSCLFDLTVPSVPSNYDNYLLRSFDSDGNFQSWTEDLINSQTASQKDQLENAVLLTYQRVKTLKQINENNELTRNIAKLFSFPDIGAEKIWQMEPELAKLYQRFDLTKNSFIFTETVAGTKYGQIKLSSWQENWQNSANLFEFWTEHSELKKDLAPAVEKLASFLKSWTDLQTENVLLIFEKFINGLFLNKFRTFQEFFLVPSTISDLPGTPLSKQNQQKYLELLKNGQIVNFYQILVQENHLSWFTESLTKKENDELSLIQKINEKTAVIIDQLITTNFIYDVDNVDKYIVNSLKKLAKQKSLLEIPEIAENFPSNLFLSFPWEWFSSKADNLEASDFSISSDGTKKTMPTNIEITYDQAYSLLNLSASAFNDLVENIEQNFRRQVINRLLDSRTTLAMQKIFSYQSKDLNQKVSAKFFGGYILMEIFNPLTGELLLPENFLPLSTGNYSLENFSKFIKNAEFEVLKTILQDDFFEKLDQVRDYSFSEQEEASRYLQNRQLQQLIRQIKASPDILAGKDRVNTQIKNFWTGTELTWANFNWNGELINLPETTSNTVAETIVTIDSLVTGRTSILAIPRKNIAELKRWLREAFEKNSLYREALNIWESQSLLPELRFLAAFPNVDKEEYFTDLPVMELYFANLNLSEEYFRSLSLNQLSQLIAAANSQDSTKSDGTVRLSLQNLILSIWDTKINEAKEKLESFSQSIANLKLMPENFQATHPDYENLNLLLPIYDVSGSLKAIETLNVEAISPFFGFGVTATEVGIWCDDYSAKSIPERLSPFILAQILEINIASTSQNSLQNELQNYRQIKNNLQKSQEIFIFFSRLAATNNNQFSRTRFQLVKNSFANLSSTNFDSHSIIWNDEPAIENDVITGVPNFIKNLTREQKVLLGSSDFFLQILKKEWEVNSQFAIAKTLIAEHGLFLRAIWNFSEDVIPSNLQNLYNFKKILQNYDVSPPFLINGEWFFQIDSHGSFTLAQILLLLSDQDIETIASSSLDSAAIQTATKTFISSNSAENYNNEARTSLLTQARETFHNIYWDKDLQEVIRYLYLSNENAKIFKKLDVDLVTLLQLKYENEDSSSSILLPIVNWEDFIRTFDQELFALWPTKWLAVFKQLTTYNSGSQEFFLVKQFNDNFNLKKQEFQNLFNTFINNAQTHKTLIFFVQNPLFLWDEKVVQTFDETGLFPVEFFQLIADLLISKDSLSIVNQQISDFVEKMFSSLENYLALQKISEIISSPNTFMKNFVQETWKDYYKKLFVNSNLIFSDERFSNIIALLADRSLDLSDFQNYLPGFLKQTKVNNLVYLQLIEDKFNSDMTIKVVDTDQKHFTWNGIIDSLETFILGALDIYFENDYLTQLEEVYGQWFQRLQFNAQKNLNSFASIFSWFKNSANLDLVSVSYNLGSSSMTFTQEISSLLAGSGLTISNFNSFGTLINTSNSAPIKLKDSKKITPSHLQKIISWNKSKFEKIIDFLLQDNREKLINLLHEKETILRTLSNHPEYWYVDFDFSSNTQTLMEHWIKNYVSLLASNPKSFFVNNLYLLSFSQSNLQKLGHNFFKNFHDLKDEQLESIIAFLSILDQTKVEEIQNNMLDNAWSVFENIKKQTDFKSVVNKLVNTERIDNFLELRDKYPEIQKLLADAGISWKLLWDTTYQDQEKFDVYETKNQLREFLSITKADGTQTLNYKILGALSKLNKQLVNVYFLKQLKSETNHRLYATLKVISDDLFLAQKLLSQSADIFQQTGIETLITKQIKLEDLLTITLSKSNWEKILELDNAGNELSKATLTLYAQNEVNSKFSQALASNLAKWIAFAKKDEIFGQWFSEIYLIPHGMHLDNFYFAENEDDEPVLKIINRNRWFLENFDVDTMWDETNNEFSATTNIDNIHYPLLSFSKIQQIQFDEDLIKKVYLNNLLANVKNVFLQEDSSSSAGATINELFEDERAVFLAPKLLLNDIDSLFLETNSLGNFVSQIRTNPATILFTESTTSLPNSASSLQINSDSITSLRSITTLQKLAKLKEKISFLKSKYLQEIYFMYQTYILKSPQFNVEFLSKALQNGEIGRFFVVELDQEKSTPKIKLNSEWLTKTANLWDIYMTYNFLSANTWPSRAAADFKFKTFQLAVYFVFFFVLLLMMIYSLHWRFHSMKKILANYSDK